MLVFDSLNNYYAIGMKNKGVDFNKDLDLTSKDSQEVVDYYRDGIEAGYFAQLVQINIYLAICKQKR